jgi:hypothetical protein
MKIPAALGLELYVLIIVWANYRLTDTGHICLMPQGATVRIKK